MPYSLGMKFENDTLYTITREGLSKKGEFTVVQKTIILTEFDGSINRESRIEELTKDSLIITGGAFDGKYYARHLEFTENLKLNEWKLIAKSCFGDCPEFNLRLTDSGLVQFEPIVNCKVTDYQEFTIDRAKKSKIDSLFKWSYLHKPDTGTILSTVDDWAFEMEISYNNGQKIKFKTTQWNIPFRLRRIFGILMTEIEKKDFI